MVFETDFESYKNLFISGGANTVSRGAIWSRVNVGTDNTDSGSEFVAYALHNSIAIVCNPSAEDASVLCTLSSGKYRINALCHFMTRESGLCFHNIAAADEGGIVQGLLDFIALTSFQAILIYL